MAVTYHTVPADAKALSHFPKLEIVASFGVGYDHVDSAYAREHNIVVTNTPDVLTEEVADVAMGLADRDPARIRQGRPLSALRPVADAELSA